MNLQNIPSKDTKIRKMFMATNDEKDVLIKDKYLALYNYLEVETQEGWKYADELIVGDIINNQTIKELSSNKNEINICFE